MVSKEFREGPQEVTQRPESDSSRTEIDNAAWSHYTPGEGLAGQGNGDFEGRLNQSPETFPEFDPGPASDHDRGIEQSDSELTEVWKRGEHDAEGEIDLDVSGSQATREELDDAAWENADVRASSYEAIQELDSKEARIASARVMVEDAHKDAGDGKPSADATTIQDLIRDRPSDGGAMRDERRPKTKSAEREKPSAERDLSDMDRETIRRYTGKDHKELNQALWSGTLDEVEAISPFSHDLSAALKKLDPHEGTVYRGSEEGRPAAAYDLDRYEPGEIIVENGHLSCTTDPEVPFNGEVLWVIESRSGRDIRPFSSLESESEILIDRFARFEVKTKETVIDVNGRPRWLIYMEEVQVTEKGGNASPDI